MKKALICGISGQDGAYLAELLLKKKYEVSRNAQTGSFGNLEKLGIKKDVQLIFIEITDFSHALQSSSTIKPDEVYTLSGKSPVGLSFEHPVETLERIGVRNLNLLEATRFSSLPVKRKDSRLESQSEF